MYKEYGLHSKYGGVGSTCIGSLRQVILQTVYDRHKAPI